MESNYLFKNLESVKISIVEKSKKTKEELSKGIERSYKEKVLGALRKQGQSFTDFRYLHEINSNGKKALEYNFYTMTNFTYCTLGVLEMNLRSLRITFKM